MQLAGYCLSIRISFLKSSLNLIFHFSLFFAAFNFYDDVSFFISFGKMYWILLFIDEQIFIPKPQTRDQRRLLWWVVDERWDGSETFRYGTLEGKKPHCTRVGYEFIYIFVPWGIFCWSEWHYNLARRASTESKDRNGIELIEWGVCASCFHSSSHRKYIDYREC